ncbi:MAG: isocitrate lyase/phosphoenolpyruvate mutase family protein [Pseudomonadota bacterium]
MTDQAAKARTFEALHTSGNMFILPNPWDVGSARILAGLGFPALATTSAGFANWQKGAPDYGVTRDDVLTHVRTLVLATDLPITADLENGFGHTPECCAETIRLGAEAGLVGGSIEDFTGDRAAPQYSIGQAAERIVAAAEAANALAFPFLVTARAENYLTGNPDLADTIARLQAYQEAGAQVLYAPGLRTLADIRTVLASIDRPLNVLLGPFEGFVSLAELAYLGVARVSMGSALANAAFGALIRAGEELLGPGTLDFLADAADSETRDRLLGHAHAPN